MNANKATAIRLPDFTSIPMRTFHMTWIAFFLCFFGWFGIAPLMAVVRAELALTKVQVANTIIASVAGTVFARLLIGWACDRFGPRRSYAALLIAGAIPVMTIGLANSYESFLLFRLAIGVIGASFVITQYHTSVMFEKNIVGTANATAAGWGNLGGGVTQMVMPLILTAFLGMGVGNYWGWRLAMVIPGVAMLIIGVLYLRFTEDTPSGNRHEPRPSSQASFAAFLEVCKDVRVWSLFVLYGACFGMELTIDNIAALYFIDYFKLDLKTAGLVAGLFGMMNLFARALGGIISDRMGLRWGLRGRTMFLGAVILGEGLALMAFSQARALPLAIGLMLFTGLFVKMSNGATYAVVPFVSKKALGAVAGIVGAGGNVGAVLFGMLFRDASLTWPQALFILGSGIAICSVFALAVRFNEADETVAQRELAIRLNQYEPASAGD